MNKSRKISPEVKQQFSFTLFCIVISSFFLFVTAVFSAPSQPAPLGSPDKPIHTGSESQTKSANLSINNQFTSSNFTATSSISTPLYCLNGSCRSSWPSASYSTPSLHQVLSNGNSTTRYLWVSTNAYVCINGTCKHYWPRPTLGSWAGTYYVNPGNGNGQYSYCPAGYLACGIRSNAYRYHTPEMIICCYTNFSSL